LTPIPVLVGHADFLERNSCKRSAKIFYNTCGTGRAVRLNIFRNESVGTVFISMACHSFAPAGGIDALQNIRRLGVFCGQK
jgi:hypothetical protein